MLVITSFDLRTSTIPVQKFFSFATSSFSRRLLFFRFLDARSKLSSFQPRPTLEMSNCNFSVSSGGSTLSLDNDPILICCFKCGDIDDDPAAGRTHDISKETKSNDNEDSFKAEWTELMMVSFCFKKSSWEMKFSELNSCSFSVSCSFFLTVSSEPDCWASISC
ncbi:hypothetical protein OGAPHI_000625 [Ogataea philodendri]|uniref:Uncharacterized protein n=1 Tax=Ogataea philodendri TaxID=1378263 RepID=A0A9P8PGB1_9ASCO|nr:uncharacterized protein OGAPHI_000625 [Ogataea philodendri]KAH3670914.1 hypothetical protein OGAPHI_000625 [Ogataea philodendri]